MPKVIWLLVIAMILNITGASFIWPFNTIYLHQYLGQSLSVSGLVLMAYAGAGVIGSLLGGHFFDKIGGYRTIVFGIIITVISAFILVAYHTFFFYVLLIVIFGFGTGIIFPSIYALAGVVWPEGERKAFNAIYIAVNVGVALGTALAGVIASFRFDYVFYANGLIYTILLIFVVVAFREIETKTIVSSSFMEQIERKKPINNVYPLLFICLTYLICWIAYVQWQSTISVHTQSLGITLTQYSVLWTINGAMIVLAQPLILFVINKWVQTLQAQIYTGLFIFICSFFVLAQADVFLIFVVAMLVLTIGEMFVWPAVPTIAHQLAPEGKAGFYQGIVNSVATGGRMIGPFIGGVIADMYGMGILFYFLIMFFLIAFVSTALYSKVVKRRKETQEKEVSLVTERNNVV